MKIVRLGIGGGGGGGTSHASRLNRGDVSGVRRRHGGRERDNSAFSLLELLVSVALLIVLFALGVGVLSKVMERGRMVQCMSNLKQIGIAAVQYAQDHEQRLPLPKDWSSTDADGGLQARWYIRLAPYLYPTRKMPPADGKRGPTGEVVRCRSGEAYKLFGSQYKESSGWDGTDYGIMTVPGKWVYLRSPNLDTNPLLVEAEAYGGNLISSGRADSFDLYIPERTRQRHGSNGINILYCSGRVAYVTNPTVDDITVRLEAQ